MSNTTRRYVADMDEGEFRLQEPSSRYADQAATWADPETGQLVLATGEDGFGLRLDEADLQQFIDFLKASMTKIRKGMT